MTLLAWDSPQRRQPPKTRRQEIYEYICGYADELDGPTPSIREISQHFGLNYKTVYVHILKLINEGWLQQERGITE